MTEDEVFLALQRRFVKECPAISEGYVRRNCPHLLAKARRYNRLRRVADSDEAIDALIVLRDELTAADRATNTERQSGDQ